MAKTKKPTVEKRNKKRDRAATEQALIQAATQLFASKGFDGTRTLEIAQRAKVNEALIARYFGGKEGLLIAVLQNDTATPKFLSEQACPASGWIPNFGDEKDLKSALKVFFKAGQKHLEERHSFISITLSQALIDPKMADLLRNKVMGQDIAIMTANLEKYFKKKFKSSELEPLVMLLMASNFSMNFMGRMVHRIDDKKVDRVIDLLVNALATHLD